MNAATMEKQPTALKGLRAKTGARVAAEQVLLAVLENAKASLWTLRQLRHGLRLARRRFYAEWKCSKTLWYVAVKSVFGCSVRKIADPRQREFGNWRRA